MKRENWQVVGNGGGGQEGRKTELGIGDLQPQELYRLKGEKVFFVLFKEGFPF